MKSHGLFQKVSQATLVLVVFQPACSEPSATQSLPLEDFRLQSSAIAAEPGAAISSPGFPDRDWLPATVPSTVLNALVHNGLYPDPTIGLNNMRIPDASDAFNETYDLLRFSHLPDKRNPWKDPYWFRTEFAVPDTFLGKEIWLACDGINYRADVWLNGAQVARSDRVVGMFERFVFNVTHLAKPGQTNALALRIHPLDTPGLPAEPQLEVLGPFGPNGGPNGDIGQNVTMQASVGWDWIPAVRDRNMGIWQEVSLSATNRVDIRFSWVRTDLPLPETSPARIDLETEVFNPTPEAISGSLLVRLSPAGFSGQTAVLEKDVSIPARDRVRVSLSPDEYPQLLFVNPQLWWPNTYGGQPLYKLELSFVFDGRTSDSETVLFGIREVGSQVSFIEGWARRDFYVNGRKILIKGGAWVPDIMLNHSPERLEAELRLSREANFNMVRIWGGGVTPRKEFFQICDRMGLLVWHDFWITGDCQGTFGKGTRDWPLEADVFLSNARDTVLRLRNHPSLLVWTAGNEGYPRKEIYQRLRNDIVATLDGTRPFLPTSGYANPDPSWGLSWPDEHESGAYSGGPYCWVDPSEYYLLIAKGQDWLFKDEVGLPSVPPLESLRRFIPDLTPDPSKPFPLNNTWGYHDAAEGNGLFSLYDRAIRSRYGEPKSLEEYVQKAQFVNAESYRAIFEAVSSHLGGTAGTILWKTNPAWPSVIWQVYDWYLRPHAGYYYARRACRPLHVLLRLDNHGVTVVNTQLTPRPGLVVEARVYGPDLALLNEVQQAADLPPETARQLFLLDLPGYESGAVRFVLLTLRQPGSEEGIDNFYWLSSNNDFSLLNRLAKVDLDVSARLKRSGESNRLTVTLQNPSGTLAFFVNPTLWRESGGSEEEILPTFWSDNYFVLLPDQKARVQAVWESHRQEIPKLRIRGWNVVEKEVPY